MPARKHPKYLTCKYCGEKYFARKAFIHGAFRKYCSIKCKNKDRAKPVLKCLYCQVEFTARATKRSDTGRQKFCSIACKKHYLRERRPVIICEQCGKSFSVYPSRLKRGNPKYCSQSCAGNMPKIENERFRRVKTREWTDIRQSILKRDRNKCAKCGSKDMLTVHHIVRWVISKDDSPSNLITLCRSCHYSVEWYGETCPTP